MGSQRSAAPAGNADPHGGAALPLVPSAGRALGPPGGVAEPVAGRRRKEPPTGGTAAGHWTVAAPVLVERGPLSAVLITAIRRCATAGR
jgi:hypothetical protein